jgi:hypothetical protein
MIPAEAGHALESESKRRKVRKGTRSCWECKRRKMRCIFLTPSDSICIACRKRGSSCVSQEYSEQAPAAEGMPRQQMHDRIVRVEALIEHLAKQVRSINNGGSGSSTMSAVGTNPSTMDVGGHPNVGIATPEPSEGTDSAQVFPVDERDIGSREVLRSSFKSLPTAANARHAAISTALHAAIPPPEDLQVMVKAGMDVSIHRILTYPYSVLTQRPGGWSANLGAIPDVDTHPALLAKYLLLVATCLQYAHPDMHAQAIRALSEPPVELIRRCSEAATSLVTSNDDFLGSFEGLECVLLEAMFEANAGNLRRAWFACRRAMVVAQMMGLHRNGGPPTLQILDPSEPVFPNYMWYRIISTDRQLSLMLGLPQGSLDNSFASDAAFASDTPSGQFERRLTAIASGVLQRNETSGPSVLNDFETLQKLDTDLRDVASDMPSKWWLVPNLVSVSHDAEQSFWEMLRLLDHVFYFNLLNLLHLPYMLRSSTPDAEHGGDGDGNGTVPAQYEYSKLASVNASRELLSRFTMFRSYNRVAYCSRSVDFFALTAAMTLIIAHLDGHRKQRQGMAGTAGATTNLLAHQRTGDRAMMEQVLDNMEAVAQLNMDLLSERSSSLLRSLLALEADAAVSKRTTWDQGGLGPTTEEQPLRIGIPYFGTVRIGHDGIVAMEAPPLTTAPSPMHQWHASSPPAPRTSKNKHPVSPTSNPSATHIAPSNAALSDHVATGMSAIPPEAQDVTSVAPLGQLEAHSSSEPVPPFPTIINEAVQQQYLYPGLTAGAEDWAFQGVDMAFFDSLIKGSELETSGESSDWTNWENE